MTVTITVTSNGPFVIASSDAPHVSVTDARGETRVNDGAPIELCRCGHSANKPYCDGTHSTIGFTDAA